MYNPLTNTFDLKMQGCDLWGDIVEAATYVNPCFNICHLTDYCPILWNIMGFLSSDAGPIQTQQHGTPYRASSTVPNTIIGHGMLDFILMTNGTLAAIQNMTWNGAQGFQKLPTEPLFAPYHPKYAEFVGENSSDPPPSTHIAGSGFLGLVHTKRPPQHGGYGRTP
ncbi:hypothetical protein EYZ11_004197 [Aspergillus tanneri]|uniref:Uncharacterized protein n=1 Tax=Aspergillus tanneri TaxID=1220188 RepID=A0A4S3JNI5_9EURO|nr:hypothetical protein EYZ11_004197 [Aspergillus tanneri]